MSALPREYEARAIAQLAALHEDDEWSDASRTVQAWVRRDGRNGEPVEPKPARAQVRSTKGIRPVSAKRLAEGAERAAVRAAVIERDQGCVGPRRGLPGECGSVSADRPRLEVNEVAKRSTHPGAHLDPSKCVALCQVHHDLITSPTGEIRELAERVGLIVRSSS